MVQQSALLNHVKSYLASVALPKHSKQFNVILFIIRIIIKSESLKICKRRYERLILLGYS